MTILAQTKPIFKPAMRIIVAISNTYPASVTTSFDHGYLSGLIIRVVVPVKYGMSQINEKFGSIIVTGTTTFDVDIDTRYFSQFVVPGSPEQYAQSIPIGEINSTLSSASKNVLPF